MKCQDLIDQIAKLEAELEQSRETNRRLNRRCQELDSLLDSILQEHAAISADMRNTVNRSRYYADLLRDAWRNKQSCIHKSYEREWKRLPKPSDGYDGIKARVDEALRLINKKRRFLWCKW